MTARGVFITGTDTGVGKTLAACAVIHALRARGVAVAPMKPVAAGAIEENGASINEDTVALLDAAGLGRDWATTTTPILLRAAMAPHIAAQREQRGIGLDIVQRAFGKASGGGRFVVVEGVGGFRVPLGDELDTVDLARCLALPVVLVVGLRLGCLNHALLTADAIAHAGLRLAGWIANSIDPDMLARDENIAALDRRIAAPRLGTLPFSDRPDAAQLAQRLDVGPLL